MAMQDVVGRGDTMLEVFNERTAKNTKNKTDYEVSPAQQAEGLEKSFKINYIYIF